MTEFEARGVVRINSSIFLVSIFVKRHITQRSDGPCSYLHRWKHANPKDALDGAFVYWNDEKGEAYVPSTPLLGTLN